MWDICPENDLTELCHNCGEKSNGQKKTIQCDVCDRWFHMQCVQEPDPIKSYSCAVCTF
ncbi:hypothetical protein C0J50_13149 [Silurus asotus]|uniref:PHD-type domain-containing protein n=1 Tax=Silurus asotus TaxID=30991 RepID=A0AAD5B4N8_SILAS|nr:hypothetical protein C0J50_13149 [Silurus asotus]